MDIRQNALGLLSRHHEGLIRVAAEEDPRDLAGVEKALASDLHNNAGQTNIKRAIPKDYKYDPKSLKPLAKMLWSMSVSLGHALAAHKQFVRLKSSTISPDGMVGGRGYVMAVKDVRTMLHDACEALSALCDTVHDEINGPHWEPRLAQLEKEEVDRIRSLMGEAERYLANPEEEAEEEEDEAETSGHAAWHHPSVQKDNKGKKDPKSQVPDGGDKETRPGAQPLRPDMRKNPQEKQASIGSLVEGTWYNPTVHELTLGERVAKRFYQANSSLPVETMPGGPRIDHLDRGDVDQTGPFGTYNQDEPHSLKDEWSRDERFGNEYNYPSDWDNDLHEKQAVFKVDPGELTKLKEEAHKRNDRDLQQLAAALDKGNWRLADQYFQFLRAKKNLHGVPEGIAGELVRRNKAAFDELGTSAFPDSNTDPTKTDGFDFGIGDGNGDQADGGGAGGYAEGNPGAPDINPGGGTGNMGVYGPQSGLPKDPGGQVHPDEGDSNLTIENEIGGKGRFAGDPLSMFMEPDENFDFGGVLPGDNDAGVARTDYYDGPKPINMMNTAPSNVGSTALPGEQMPAKPTPTSQRPSHNQEHMFGTGELPGDNERVDYDYNRDIGPDQTTTFEQTNTPYIKWDYNTPEMRPDPIHQRDPIQGPYVHNDLEPSNG